MAYFNQVSLAGFHHEPFHLTMNVSGLAGTVVSGDPTVIGKAVTLDTAAANTCKLAGNGDRIIGVLRSIERRGVEGTVVGAVEFRFSDLLPIAASAQATMNIGDTAVGAGSGEIKARRNAGDTADEPDWTDNIVVEVRTGFAVVTKF